MSYFLLPTLLILAVLGGCQCILYSSSSCHKCNIMLTRKKEIVVDQLHFSDQSCSESKQKKYGNRIFFYHYLLFHQTEMYYMNKTKNSNSANLSQMTYLTLQSYVFRWRRPCTTLFSKHNILSLKCVLYQMQDKQNTHEFNLHSQHALSDTLRVELQVREYTKVSVKDTSHGNLPLNTLNFLVVQKLCI